ncbi:hypothetical protein BD289DRAFT_501238 [Coniella lustricola]|uniref:D-isomer specific 2-hydroxyacid dehydrogenase NAD-binding domain-containing protein n=1 Tax=Coniella lustricola TaxID=2025994 RepID=A0A2T3A5P4_9PEZI|nr:hypothetical protein BD289DRAFT_501238 [Coniella lustricola]
MVLVRYPPNKNLKGHKLVSILPSFTPSDEEVAGLKQQYPGLEILIANSRAEVTKEDWQDATILATGFNQDGLPHKDDVPNLQYVQLSSAGANLITSDPLYTDTDVAFCTANGVHGPQIAEWIIATFLAFQHEIPAYLEQQKQGQWIRRTQPVYDAVKQRVGILGYGSIGRQTARVAKAMGMDVYAYTLHERKTPESKRDTSYAPPGLGDPDGSLPSKWFYGDSTRELHAFLGSGLDLLIVAMPLTPKTTGLIGKAEFEVLKANKTFVTNIARGPIIKTDDLIEALDHGLIRGAALDVTDPEPLPDGHPLWFAKNVIITPHISAASTSYFDRLWEIVKLNLRNLSRGKDLLNQVNRTEGY